MSDPSIDSSITSDHSDQSYLTDEVLQEVVDYEHRHRSNSSLHHRQQQGEKQQPYEYEIDQDTNDYLNDIAIIALVSHDRDQQPYEYEIEQDTNDYLNDIAHIPLVSPDRDQHHRLQQDGCENHYSPSKDDSSLPTTSTEGGGELDQKLCWRSNPSRSLSDWELHIFNRSTKNFETYHVHRVVLALGPRGCEFFQDIFRQAEAGVSPTAASVNKITRVPLMAESCKIVGCFLDYVYGNEQFEITNENALGMCYLADYFRNNSLWELATDFIEEDLGTPSGREHLSQYYLDSIYYDQDEFLDHILSVCSRELLSMKEDGIPCSKLLGELLSSHFFRILIDMKQPTGEELSSNILLTRLITEYCSLHRNELSMETFDNLTSRIILLNSSSALALLEASLEYDCSSYDATDNQSQMNKTENSVSSLTFFRQQCIETMSEEWEELLELDQSRLRRVMRILTLREEHQGIVVDWFQKTLERASAHLTSSRQETERAQQQNFLAENRHNEIEEKLDVAKGQTETSQRDHRTTKSEMKTQLSSWVRKNEATNQRRQVEQEQWEQERLRWQMECQQWKYERSKLKREVKNLRSKISSLSQNHSEYSDQHTKHSSNHDYDRRRGTSSPVQDEPFLIPNESFDGSGSYGTGSSSSSDDSSFLDDADTFPRRDPNAYPIF